jgi:RNA polymerase sigma-70 factor (ECF subfamily)
MPLTATPGQETAAPARRPHYGALSTCTLRHASDDGLVALTRAGSERAFAEIMRRYQRPLQFYCMHLVGAPRAEDAVQQAFMQAFVSLRDGARREIALRPWLYRIARNCAIDLLRKQPFDHDELDPEFDGMPQTPGVYEQKEELARVVAAIQALPEGQRRALTLRELEGRSYGEISAELGHTDSGVRQLIFRARTALRNLGALILPVGSVRWRLVGSSSSSAIADPHQVAVAATVSSTGGGSAMQAAASAVAATVTLLSAGVPAERHDLQAATQAASTAPIVQQLPGSSVPFTGGAVPVTTRRAGDRKHGRKVIDVGGPATALSSDLVPVPVALTAPVTPAVQPVVSLPVDPPSVPTLTDASAGQRQVTAGALGGSVASATDTTVANAAGAPSGRTSSGGVSADSSSLDRSAPVTSSPQGIPPVKPAVAPVKAGPATKVAVPAPSKPAATPKGGVAKPAAPKKPGSPKAPASSKAPASAKVPASKVPASPLTSSTPAA